MLPLPIFMTIALVCGLVGAKTSFSVGNNLPNDEIITSQEEMARGASDYIYNIYKTYPGDNYHVITKVVCDDISDRGIALAAVVAGGPGHTFVTIAYTLPRLTHMKFNISLFGKPPAFRKIP